MANNDTNFGYEKVSPREKTRRVNKVFSSVADEYNLMNDIMSFGIHKLWKRFTVSLCCIRKDFHVLDLACGTGDITKLVYEKLGEHGHITLCDINESMLNHGRDNLINKGIIKNIDYIRANAENLPFKDNSFDCVIIAFGLRNITDKNAALKSIYKKLKYGTQLVILEFSKVTIPFIDKIYLKYAFKFIPKLGKAVVKDADSYRYLIESIRVHPDQKQLVSMIEEAGFRNIKFHNLSAGIVAVHRGYKI
jgi:demethylmenaquinone methyltransferase/2-methoxy-6-polyprenyl-1,4-benzoquinol methylase